MNEALLKTPLHDLHVAGGGKMVPFAGYSMPLQYGAGLKKEHLHTREKAGLFDVSHMGQIKLTGEGAALALEKLVPVDIVDLPQGKQRYALFTNDQGGILDDLMVANLGDCLFLVVNAACKAQDISHLQANLPKHIKLEVLDRALVALQGPLAAKILARFVPQVNDMVFMDARQLSFDGAEVIITRSGYTGEDGFEVSMPAEKAQLLAEKLVAEPEIELIGLGARDSLRLESGLCLYGEDIDQSTTPVEASLIWAISPVRRVAGRRAGDFLGSDKILQQIVDKKPKQKRVGFQVNSRSIVRAGVEILNTEDQVVGRITSGSFSPSLDYPVAMGYLDVNYSKLETEVFALLRGKKIPMTVKKMPFVPQNYFRG